MPVAVPRCEEDGSRAERVHSIARPGGTAELFSPSSLRDLNLCALYAQHLKCWAIFTRSLTGLMLAITGKMLASKACSNRIHMLKLVASVAIWLALGNIACAAPAERAMAIAASGIRTSRRATSITSSTAADTPPIRSSMCRLRFIRRRRTRRSSVTAGRPASRRSWPTWCRISTMRRARFRGRGW